MDTIPGEGEAVLEDLSGGEGEEDVRIWVVLRTEVRKRVREGRTSGRFGVGSRGRGASIVFVTVRVGEGLGDVHIVIVVEI